MSINLVGRILLSQFRVDSFVAAGGMGAVYRVWDLKRNTPLAMKVLHADLADDPLILKRFKREANALKKLTHPNIVRFYGFYQTEEVAFLLEHYVDGRTLKEVLHERDSGQLSVEESLVYLKAISAALGYAHAHGVIHCDLKPGNVMIDQGGAIYVTDFGIARHAESVSTTLGFSGTAAYMAPEQCRAEPVSPQTDVYAMGILLYEMLTGARPFRGDEKDIPIAGTVNERVRYAQIHLPPPDPHQHNYAIPGALSSVISSALTKKPEERYHNTRDLFEAASRAVSVSPDAIPDRISVRIDQFDAIQAPNTPREQFTVRDAWRQGVRGFPVQLGLPLWVPVAGVVALLMLILGFVFVRRGGHSPLGSASLPDENTAVVERSDNNLGAIDANLTQGGTPTITLPTDTPVPIVTPTSEPEPTATVPSCAIRPLGEFASLWSRYEEELGCADYAEPRLIADAEQLFQQGHMFWRADIDIYYVIYDGGGARSGDWSQYDGKYNEGGLAACPELAPPDFVKLASGFGNVWCALGGENADIGWALDDQYGFGAGQGVIRVHDFQSGTIFQDSDGWAQGLVYLLFSDGQFIRAAL